MFGMFQWQHAMNEYKCIFYNIDTRHNLQISRGIEDKFKHFRAMSWNILARYMIFLLFLFFYYYYKFNLINKNYIKKKKK